MENLRIKDLNYAKKAVNESSNIKTNKSAVKNNSLFPNSNYAEINRKLNAFNKSNAHKSPSKNTERKLKATFRKELTFSCETKKKVISSPTSKIRVNSTSFKSPRFLKNETITCDNNILLSSTNTKYTKGNVSNNSSSYSRTKHSSSSISSKKINKQIESDYNSIVDKKFYNEACEIGKKNLITKSVKLSSPNRMEVGGRNKMISPKNEYNSFVYNSKMNFTCTNDKKPSESVLTDMLDLQYSNCSPQRKKFNFEKSNKEEKRSEAPERIILEQDKTINLSFSQEAFQETLLEAFEAFRYYIGNEFLSLQKSEQIDKAIKSLSDNKKSFRLGGIIYLYISIKSKHLNESLCEKILVRTIELLKVYEKYEELFLISCLELLSNFGPDQKIIDIIPLISMFLTDFNFPKLQRSAFNCLMSLEFDGIKSLVDIAIKESSDLQTYVLSNLLKTPHIQKIIIIPALLNDLFSNNTDKIHNSLSALNRLYDLLNENDTLKILNKFFNNPSIEKQLLASTIRSAGTQGEDILLENLVSTNDFKIKVAISSVLSYRIPRYPKYITIKLEHNGKKSFLNNPPGNLYKYVGKVSPIALENNDLEINNDYIEVNARDFLAALQRMLLIRNDHSNPRLVIRGNHKFLDNFIFYINRNEKFNDFIDLPRSEDSSNVLEEEKFEKILISENVIYSLRDCLKDPNAFVRETAVSSLGKIGLPEAILCVDAIVDLVSDPVINVKTKAIWCVGKLASCCDISAIHPIVDNLKSNVWKVKMACFVTISSFGPRCSNIVLPSLKKMLKENSINKQIIAETIINLGNDGEHHLIDLMRTEIDSNYKLKSSIAKSFAMATISSPNIDFIIECLFRHVASNSNLIRKASLFSLKTLHTKSKEKITYLKTINILPIYYKCLQDKDPEIQSLAISAIKELGPQGEIVFKEGLTKDSNSIVRCQCVIGLAEIGLCTIKTILSSLNDDSDIVRKTIEREILQRYSIDAIVEYYSVSYLKAPLQLILNSILENKNIKISNNFVNFIRELNVSLSLRESATEKQLIPSEKTENKSLNISNRIHRSDLVNEGTEMSIKINDI